jgi:hypothetical protein
MIPRGSFLFTALLVFRASSASSNNDATGPRNFHTCENCVANGFGWSEQKQKCGGYATTSCKPASSADAAADSAATGAAAGPAPSPTTGGADTTQGDAPSRAPLTELVRITMSELQQMPDLLEGGTPFVLTDATEDWRAMDDWYGKDFFPPVFSPVDIWGAPAFPWPSLGCCDWRPVNLTWGCS